MFRYLIPKINMKQYIKYRLPSFRSEIYLIEWLPNIKTEIHDHYGKDCNFIVLIGPLFEKRYFKKNNESEVKVYHRYERGFINDSIGKHRMINFTNSKKWSIHRYSS